MIFPTHCVAVVAALSVLSVAASPGLAGAGEDPSSGVSLSASVFASFEASPTLDSSNPDLFGGSNGLFATGNLDQSSVSDSFREIYQGVGESGTSLFEVDYSGFASLAGQGSLEVDLLAVDHNNASASRWTASGGAGHYEWLRFSGPTDTSGNYVITLTTNLGSFTAVNTQPPGFTSIWRATASTALLAEPLDTNFASLSRSAFATLTKDCESLNDPPCFGHSRLLSSTGDVTVPGSNPVLLISHSLSVSARSADVHTGGASLEMDLPPGVTATAYQPIPEPAPGFMQFAALAALFLMRRRISLAAHTPNG